MNIALITPRYPPNGTGGGEISVQLLAEHLRDHREIDRLSVYSFDGTATETVHGVAVHRLGEVPKYPYELHNVFVAKKLLDQLEEYDLVHSYNMLPHPAVGYLSSTNDIPSVATLNAYPFFPRTAIGIKPSLRRRLYEAVGLTSTWRMLSAQMKNITIFLPLSHSVKRRYRQWEFDNAEFEVIPNMIDPDFEVPTTTRDTDDNTIKLLYVGYLRKSKGISNLIESLQWLSSEFTLELVGTGPEEERLRRLVETFDLEHRVSFSGYLPYDDVKRSYANADVFVHPGIWPEPFGRTILEAMQAELPVVATDIGGPAEVIPQEEFLCEPGDPEDLARGIRAASAADGVGRSNEQYVETEYAPETVLEEILDVYRRVQ